MHCPYCGTESAPNSNLCRHCGRAIHIPNQSAPLEYPSNSGLFSNQPFHDPFPQQIGTASNGELSINLQVQSNPIGISRPNGSTELAVKQSQQSSQRRLQHGPLRQSPSLRTNRLIRESKPLVAGTLLYGERYRLSYKQGQQQWLAGAYETSWIAQDTHRQGAPVMISEVSIPGDVSHVVQSLLRTAIHILSSTSKLSYAVKLLDVFREHGKDFFVFQAVNGVSLLSYLQHTGNTLQEQEVIRGCLEITRALEKFSHQSLVHGLICPEHIIVEQGSLKWYLTNFSIFVSARAIQYISGIDRSLLSPYTAPEFSSGVIDARSDLYALMATAYQMVTGALPTNASEPISQSQRSNSFVSSPLAAIFSKGLHPILEQRYQQPSELLQDLLALSSASNISSIENKPPSHSQQAKQHYSASERQTSPTSVQVAPDAIEQIFSTFTSQAGREISKDVLLHPEELPPLPQSNDILIAACWLTAILICLFILVLLP
jgi:hypothetical protein